MEKVEQVAKRIVHAVYECALDHNLTDSRTLKRTETNWPTFESEAVSQVGVMLNARLTEVEARLKEAEEHVKALSEWDDDGVKSCGFCDLPITGCDQDNLICRGRKARAFLAGKEKTE